jgi:uncharacterized protein YjbI with pentapeptide repeats
MANQEQIKMLLELNEIEWNQWREQHPEIQLDLRRAELQGSNLSNKNLNGADLRDVRFAWAELRYTQFVNADLRGVLINDARAPYANFSGSQLNDAYLWGSDFRETIFCKANLTGADLRNTQLARANFSGAKLIGCKVYGISAWELELEGAEQTDLIITPPDEPTVTVDNLEVAQFVFLLLNNKRIRDVLDTVTRKAVLILGRFTSERKAVLDAIREKLRHYDYVPILFDFDKPDTRNVRETVRTLAHLSRFIIADVTEPKSIPLELETIIPQLRVPVQPLLLKEHDEFSMFADLRETYH